MERTQRDERRLDVLARYQDYVDALRLCHLDPDAVPVRESRRALARSIEAACIDDPNLLADFKRAFATQHRA
ncbi:MAG TPA: hypothetical protein VFB58_00020 [Chloroflexota bacterium]|nr:hypothetical protein [Chloroflexota bacterium]